MSERGSERRWKRVLYITNICYEQKEIFASILNVLTL